MEPVAVAYYLDAVGEAEVIVGQAAIRITVPIRTPLLANARRCVTPVHQVEYSG